MQYFKKVIRKILGRDIINQIYYWIGFKYINQFKQYNDVKKIIHILTPIHGNMGDQAIVYATNKFLKDKFSEYEILEIYRKDIYRYARAIKYVLNNDDIIVLIGGGNMGNLWLGEEKDRRFIINCFPNNKIISMPQTISFTNDKNGEKELKKSRKIYNKHKDLNLIAREEKSFNIMKKNFFNNKIYLNPDTVLYLNDLFKANYNRKYIMTCLRNDKESVIGKQKDDIIKELNKKYSEVFNYDTVISKLVMKSKREEELFDMFQKFREAKLVITDRLHGMVFAVITKTPCIVTKSLDHKVIGTYEWIKNLNYIKLVDNLNIESIDEFIEDISKLEEYNDIDFDKLYFNNIKKMIV